MTPNVKLPKGFVWDKTQAPDGGIWPEMQDSVNSFHYAMIDDLGAGYGDRLVVTNEGRTWVAAIIYVQGRGDSFFYSPAQRSTSLKKLVDEMLPLSIALNTLGVNPYEKH